MYFILWRKNNDIYSFILWLCFFAVPFAQAASPQAHQIWDVADQNFISEKTLIRKLAASEKIIMGINPDNPDHFRGAANIIDHLAKRGQNPALLLGYIERDKQNAFAIFKQRQRNLKKPYDATGLDMLLGVNALNWPRIRPVFDVAMEHGLPLKAAGLSRYEVGQIHRNGLNGLPADISKTLTPLLSVAPTQEMRQYLISLITRDYCGKLPQKIIEKFLFIHRARSAFFALSLTQSPAKISLLIVPQKYMAARNSLTPFRELLAENGKYTRLIFQEGKQDNIPPKTGAKNVDYIWITPGTGRGDPCGIFQAN